MELGAANGTVSPCLERTGALGLALDVEHADAASRQPVPTTAVGASYAFDPGVDGLASIYAARVLERGIDPRALCAEIRADRLGLVDRGPQRRALLARTRTVTLRPGHRRASALAGLAEIQLPRSSVTARMKRQDRATSSHDRARDFSSAGRASWRRRVSPLSFCCPSASSSPTPRTPRCSRATSCSRAIRSTASPRSLVSIRRQFSPPATSQNPPSLTPDEIIVIPDPSESPEAAAWSASQQRGRQPVRRRRPRRRAGRDAGRHRRAVRSRSLGAGGLQRSRRHRYP